MDKALSNFTGLEIFFFICAVIGGSLFFIRLVLQLIGADHDVDTDFDVGNDAGHGDADISFKLLTMHGLTAFFMMFGLVGIALFRQSGAGAFVSISGGTAAGFATVWVIGKLFSSAKKLQSSGTVDIIGAIGCEGTVYTTIPANGTGSVQIIIKNRLREFDASSHTKEELKTGEKIKVVWVNGNILTVEKG